MQVRILPSLLALLVLALWPQSLVLCVTACGHVELELAGAPCCPEENGECEGCVDVTAPENRRALVTLDPLPEPSPEPADELPVLETVAPPSVPAGDVGAEQDGVVLLI